MDRRQSEQWPVPPRTGGRQEAADPETRDGAGPDAAPVPCRKPEEVRRVLQAADKRDRDADRRDADARVRDGVADERDRLAGVEGGAASEDRGRAEVDRDWSARDRDHGPPTAQPSSRPYNGR